MFAAFFHHANTENYATIALDRFSCNSIGREETSGKNMSRGEVFPGQSPGWK